MARLGQVVIFAVALVCCLAEVRLGSDKHNYINCPRPDEAKTLLLDDSIQLRPRFLSTQQKTYIFPGETLNTKRITCIMITDMAETDQGGYIEVVDGGIGNYDVTIHFTTQFGKGLQFRIRIYGQ